jgi:predicted Zn-dependent protease with MMP-like domain/Flp pilus assembly protein TadD
VTSKKNKNKSGSDAEPVGANGDREEELERLVVESMAAWEKEDFPKALRLGEQACELAPQAAVAHHCRAAALAELDRLEEAQQACERGLELAPDDLDAISYGADFYIACLGDEPGATERGLELAERGLRAARKAGDEEVEFECLLLRGRAQEQLGQLAEALASVEEALGVVDDDAEALTEQAILLFELCRFEEAKAALEDLAEADEELAAPHHYLALIAERHGDAKSAEKLFARARQLAPDDFPPPVQMPQAEFDRVIEEAMESLPARVRDYLRNVAVTVEEIPKDEDLRASDPPLSPMVLGMFRGSPLGEQHLLDPWAHFPSSIVLYQRNLERTARDREELVEQIAVTLLHEVGHFLGLDEEDLRERGLD